MSPKSVILSIVANKVDILEKLLVDSPCKIDIFEKFPLMFATFDTCITSNTSIRLILESKSSCKIVILEKLLDMIRLLDN